MRLAFFAAGDQGTANPEYELALDLLANGIARSMLLDYGDFVFHVFDKDARDFYDLERLWRDAPKVELPDNI